MTFKVKQLHDAELVSGLGIACPNVVQYGRLEVVVQVNWECNYIRYHQLTEIQNRTLYSRATASVHIFATDLDLDSRHMELPEIPERKIIWSF